MSEERSEIERAGQHIEYELDIQAGSQFAALPGPLERFTHRVAAGCQNLLSKGLSQGFVLGHIRDEACKGASQWTSERIQ